MKFNELVTDISKWKSIPIRKHDKSEKLIAFGREDNPESANGWTYVYTVDGIVKYIGNSENSYLKKRILPELNQKSTIRNISNESGKLGYTNIRLSQLLLNEVYPGNNSLVELKYLDELSWDFIQGEDEIRIGEDRNFCFECNFLLCYLIMCMYTKIILLV